jgi:hypothetical protein
MGRLAKSATAILRESTGVAAPATSRPVVEAVAASQRPLAVRRPGLFLDDGHGGAMLIASAVSGAITPNTLGRRTKSSPISAHPTLPSRINLRLPGCHASLGRRDASRFRLLQLARTARMIASESLNISRNGHRVSRGIASGSWRQRAHAGSSGGNTSGSLRKVVRQRRNKAAMSSIVLRRRLSLPLSSRGQPVIPSRSR